MSHQNENTSVNETENDNLLRRRQEDNPSFPFFSLSKLWKYGPGYYIDYLFQLFFYHVGKFVASIPVTVCVASLMITLAFGLGITLVKFETDPQKLWVPDDSDTVQQKNYFDEQFTPFFRIEQMIFTLKQNTTSNDINNIIRQDVLLEIMDIQDQIRNIAIKHPDNESVLVTLNDLCFTPVPNKGCMIQSPLEYYQNNKEKIESETDAVSYFYKCIVKQSLSSSCRSSLGIPIYPKQVLGDSAIDSNTSTISANAFIVTYLLNNDEKTASLAKLWEIEFLKIASQEKKFINIFYSSERSVQDELDRETTGDIVTIAISYVAMFIYVALSLGQIHPIKSKVALGLAGVLIVIMSVVISAGICCLLQVKATLIISEVIPFLILAIGVDNMFILANHVETTDPKLPIPVRMGQTLASVGTSMALASLSEFLAFMLGSLTRMPAVQAFCLYAGIAVLANFLLQITAFVALLSIDLRRVSEHRLEFEPFIKAPSLSNDWLSIGKVIKVFIDKIYAPFILFTPIRILVLVIFIGFTGFSIYGARNLEQGLDQITALPSDSYLVNYFTMQRKYLDLGPPVYFVTKDIDYTTPEMQDKLMDMFDKVSHTKYIDKGSTMFWLESFKRWAYTPGLAGCVKKPIVRSDHIPPELFVPYLKEFLSQDVCCTIIGTQTPLCGFQFRSDVKIVDDKIVAARLMTQTVTLRDQADFINSMKAAYYTSDLLELGKPSFPYSIYYIYFAQYLYLPEVATANILIATGAVLLTTLILLANPISSVYILLCLFMIDADLLGMMGYFNIYFNSLSVVNLVMSIGISVEFCVHITKSFLHAEGSHAERAHKALVEMGSSVFSGITLTKLIGVIILYFSKSEIFRIYYFEMYLGIVIFGMFHGLAFLPCLLAMFGPETVKSTHPIIEYHANSPETTHDAATQDNLSKDPKIILRKISQTYGTVDDGETYFSTFHSPQATQN